MRALAALAAACAALVGAIVVTPAGLAAPAKPKPSWAEPQIEIVVAAGLLADSVGAFAPDALLTQRALAGALDLLALGSEDGAASPYRVVAADRAVTIRELDAAAVGFLGLGDSARAITAQLKAAGLAPKAGTGSETIARLLGLRVNHPAADDARELAASDPATRAEAAFTLARLLQLSPWHVERVRGQAATFALPELTAWQRRILSRAVSFVGLPYIWGGTSELPQQPLGKATPGGFDCSGFIWRVFKLEPFEGASALATVLRGRTTYELSGEVGPARRIKNARNLQPGDLLFQGAAGPRSKPAQVDHAAIYLGGGWFVHASGSGTTLHPFEGWYRDRFAWARRPLREAGLA